MPGQDDEHVDQLRAAGGCAGAVRRLRNSVVGLFLRLALTVSRGKEAKLNRADIGTDHAHMAVANAKNRCSNVAELFPLTISINSAHAFRRHGTVITGDIIV